MSGRSSDHKAGFGPVVKCYGFRCLGSKREGTAIRDGWQVCLRTEYLFCSDECHETYHEIVEKLDEETAVD
jgi:hypothetical protein